MLTSAQIRQQFLDFFKSKGHHIIPSAPIIIKNDPTLLFTNAGMNQFKDYFLGNKKPEFVRVADTQKCLRVSGKHNDLEEVGIDTYHHTMFEMLGNWSFGDYFKKEAIAWSWELLTEVYQIPKDQLYVTVFEGDKKEGLPKDEEAFKEWKKWIPADRILWGNKKDNFWEMGDTGPCGPCSEIHVDCRTEAARKKTDGKCLVNAGDPQVIEIWNNVFMEFNRLKDGTLQPLPARHVDTGMGLERLVRVLQQKQSNYDTDLFTPTIHAVEKLTGINYSGGDSREAIAFRVIADHIRAICFTIADEQLPSNTGAGYVIRRILRRAVRYYYSFLNVREPLLCDLVPVIADEFENVFPELKKQEAFVAKVVTEEEEAFLRTLEKGLQRIAAFFTNPLPDNVDKNTTEEEINQRSQDAPLIKNKIIPGHFAFELYDTYGFPLDLTLLIAKENDWHVDVDDFYEKLEQQKNRSRAATATDTGDWIILKEGTPQFVGYTQYETQSSLLRYRKIKSKSKEQYQLVLDKTPFYAESGGQVGDTGILDFEGEKISVTDTKKENDLIIHFTENMPAHADASIIAHIDEAKRKRTALNHSATHLLHAALRKILGTHVQQKGSLVNADYLRFDFSHFAKMTSEELQFVEEMVNEKIRENIPVVIKELPKEEALKSGAMALFGEKYGDVVRVVIMDPSYSIELCGGTHVGQTGEIGLFRFLQETAVAAGVRRVEAFTGEKAWEFVNDQLSILQQVKEQLKNPRDILKSIDNLLQEKTLLEKRLSQLEDKQLQQIADTLRSKALVINDISFIGEIVETGNAEALKKICFELKKYFATYVVLLTANIDGKAAVALLIDDNTAADKKWDASQIIKSKISPLIKGGGGGQKTLATAGGQDTSHFQDVIDQVKSIVAEK